LSKKIILTSIGILLAFAIAYAGWVLTNSFIDIRAEALLSDSGTTQVNMPAPAITISSPVTEPSDEYGFSEYSTTQYIIPILQNWESPGRLIPHEPTESQITMGQAIEIGRRGLEMIIYHELILPEQFLITHTNAFLSQNLPPDWDGRFLDPRYSYWTVSFVGDMVSSTLLINAMTGQIWRYDITLYRVRSPSYEPTENDLEAILDDFMSESGILNNERFHVRFRRDGISAYRHFAYGEAHAVLNLFGRSIEDNIWTFFRFELYLATGAPQAHAQEMYSLYRPPGYRETLTPR